MIDSLTALTGEAYKITPKIGVRNPTLREIYHYGEQQYFGLAQTICATPADRKVEIWDAMNTYWDRIDEYELFVSTFRAIQLRDTKILFGDLPPRISFVKLNLICCAQNNSSQPKQRFLSVIQNTINLICQQIRSGTLQQVNLVFVTDDIDGDPRLLHHIRVGIYHTATHRNEVFIYCLCIWDIKVSFDKRRRRTFASRSDILKLHYIIAHITKQVYHCLIL